MGKRSAHQIRTARLGSVDVSPLERETIKQYASESGLAVAAYVRAMALRQPLGHRIDVEALRPLVGQLARLGNNLNQISHHLNASGEIAVGLERTLSEVRSVSAEAVAIVRGRR